MGSFCLEFSKKVLLRLMQNIFIVSIFSSKQALSLGLKQQNVDVLRHNCKSYSLIEDYLQKTIVTINCALTQSIFIWKLEPLSFKICKKKHLLYQFLFRSYKPCNTPSEMTQKSVFPHPDNRDPYGTTQADWGNTVFVSFCLLYCKACST